MDEEQPGPMPERSTTKSKQAVNDAISSVDMERMKAALGDLGKAVDPATMRSLATGFLLRDSLAVKRALTQAGKSVDKDQLKASLGSISGSFDKDGLKSSASSFAQSVDVDSIKQKSGQAARSASKLGEDFLGKVKTKLGSNT